jgi:Ca2+-binding EF-hand superfamily protein
MGALSSKHDVVVRESALQLVELKADDVDQKFKVLEIDGKTLVEIISRHLEKAGDDMTLPDAVAPFDDLSLRDIENIWTKVFDVAESFAINERQLRSILSVLAPSLGVSPHDLSIASNDLFKRFDDRQQGWVDVLEILAAVTLLANVTTIEKIDLIFDCFDMSNDMSLDHEELTLSLKSTICGLAKVDQEWSRAAFPNDSELRMVSEKIAEVRRALALLLARTSAPLPPPTPH